jgi:DNA-binding FadR family transcriptional regulator
MARRYFSQSNARAASRTWYADLLDAARSGNAEAAATATRQAMRESMDFWRALS